MEILSIFIVLIIFGIGHWLGETAKERRKRRCWGKEHIFNRTGYLSESTILDGRPKFYCSVCDTGFDAEKKEIPDVIGKILSIKELAGYYPEGELKESWEQVKKYIQRALEN